MGLAGLARQAGVRRRRGGPEPGGPGGGGGEAGFGQDHVTGSGPGVGQSGWLSRGISEPRSSGADCGVQTGGRHVRVW